MRTRVGIVLAVLAAGILGCSSSPSTDGGVDSSAGDGTAADVNLGDGGDGGDAGGDAGGNCPAIAFVSPTANQVLGQSANLNSSCSAGFAYNVEVAVNAPQGTNLELLVGGRVAGTGTVSGPTVTFSNVSLDTHATSMLGVRVAGSTAVCATESVTTQCNTPQCTILRPSHSTLTSADNLLTAGTPGFAIDFVIGTDVPDGQPVSVSLSDRGSPLMVMASGGMATFPAVMFAMDGMYRVQASCTDAAGNVGRSTSTVFTVAATLPTLAVTSPMNNAVIGLSADVDSRAGTQFNVCAHSNAAGQNLCAAVSGASPDAPQGCGTVPMSATRDVCVQVTCPSGSAPFNVDVTTQDTNGNPARVTLTGIQCQSSLPSVRIVSPAAFNSADPTTYLNASRDIDPATPGLQANVIACVDRMAGMASLAVNGTTVGTPVAVAPTVTGDPCAAIGMGFIGIARFASVTLPDSTPEVVVASQIATVAAPTMQVTDTDPSGDVGRSALQVAFVDSQAPTMTVINPGCGAVLVAPAGTTSVLQNLDIGSGGVFPVNVTITHPGGRIENLTATSAATGTGLAHFAMETFELGDSTVTATATDPAGNMGTSAAGCTIHVGNPPQITFVSPTDGQSFSAVGDASPSTPGYQSVPVTLTTDAPVGTMFTLAIPGNTPVTVTSTGATVSFGPQSLPEGSYAFTVTTSDVTGRGVGMASVHVIVDTQPPSAPGALTAAVAVRRAGSILLSFTDASDPAPAGGTRAVARYEVRYSTTPVTSANYAVAPTITAAVTPGTPGSANTATVSGLRLGATYYFGVRAFDAVGNGTPIASVATTPSPGVRLDVVEDTFTDAAVSLGYQVSGGYDLNGDAYADVVVASGGGQARVYFGSATGISASNYALISGSASTGFGQSAVSLGDFNGDGVGDVAVGASFTSTVYLYLGRAGHGTGPMARSWPTLPASLTVTDADMVITADTGTPYAAGYLGYSIPRMGDFNCDGLADLAFSAPYAGTGSFFNRSGGAMVVFGRATVPATLSVPSAASVVITHAGSDEIWLGFPLSGGGFLTGGDRCEDLLVTSRQATDNSVSRVYLFAGQSVATPPLNLHTSDAAVTYTGMPTYQSVVTAGIGDYNGDGQGDFAIGSAGNGTVPANSGTYGTTVMFLSNGSGGFNQTTVPGTNYTLGFGFRLAGLWNASSLHPSLLAPSPVAADLVAGMDAWGGGSPRVDIWAGGTSATLDPNTPDDYVSTVGTGSAVPTTSINWLGDVDHDGYPDLGVGQQATHTFFILH